MDAKAQNARKVSDLSRAVAYQIRAERSARGLTQKEGYLQVGMPKGTYIRIEKAERPADLTQLEQIASAFGITVMTLVKRATEKLAAGEVPPRPTDPTAPVRKTNAQKAQDYRDRTHPPESGEHPRREDLA